FCGPTKAYPRLALRSAATWTFIMAGVHTRALTAPRPIKPTSPRCHSAWQPNPGRGSTYRCGKSVQTTGTTSQITSWKAQLEEGAAEVFGPGGGNGAGQPAVDVKSLHAKIGELTLENDFLEGALGRAGLLSAKR